VKYVKSPKKEQKKIWGLDREKTYRRHGAKLSWYFFPIYNGYFARRIRPPERSAHYCIFAHIKYKCS